LFWPVQRFLYPQSPAIKLCRPEPGKLRTIKSRRSGDFPLGRIFFRIP